MAYASAKSDLEERMKTSANDEIYDVFAASREEVEKGLGTQEDGDLFDSDEEPNAANGSDLFDSDDEVGAGTEASPSGAANAIDLGTPDKSGDIDVRDSDDNDNNAGAEAEVQKQWL